MRKWLFIFLFSFIALGAAVTTAPTQAKEAQAAESTTKKGLVEENGKYYYYKNGKKIKNTLKKVTVNGKAKYYYFGSKGAAYTKKWKTIKSSSGKKYRYYFGKDGVAYASGTTKSGKAKEPVVKTIKGKKYAFDYKGRALTGVQVIDEKFYYFNSNGKKNDTKTSKLRKAAKYEKNFSTLKSLLKKYGCKLKKTKYYSTSCYGDGKDGVLTYSNFKINVFKYRKSGKVIVFGAEWRRNT